MNIRQIYIPLITVKEIVQHIYMYIGKTGINFNLKTVRINAIAIYGKDQRPHLFDRVPGRTRVTPEFLTALGALRMNVSNLSPAV